MKDMDNYLMMHLLGFSKNKQKITQTSNKHTCPIAIQREITIVCYKIILGGGSLDENTLEKIILSVCMKYNIPLYPKTKDAKRKYEKMLVSHKEDEAFIEALKNYVKSHEKSSKPFWIVPKWKTNFTRRWNIKYGKTYKTFYSKSALLCQLVPSLEMTFALRELSEIEPGQGQIWNLDESMTYRFIHSSKSYTL